MQAPFPFLSPSHQLPLQRGTQAKHLISVIRCRFYSIPLLDSYEYWQLFARSNKQLLDEAEYDMKNYTDVRGCYPPKPKAEVDNTLQGLHNSSYHTKAEFKNCFISQL